MQSPIPSSPFLPALYIWLAPLRTHSHSHHLLDLTMSTVATQGEIKDLILQLQALLSTEVNRSKTTKVGGKTTHSITLSLSLLNFYLSTNFLITIVQLLKEICYHIKRLQTEVDDLSNTISARLAPSDDTS